MNFNILHKAYIEIAEINKYINIDLDCMLHIVY